ncbi:putative ABC transport system permease protein [Rhodococcus rhodochrous J3]|uniref:ABC transport system permease protein n=1 Tax=Rhodococcus rhodochrous J3 TaxID=903528 RepID=A0ABY1M8D0_RHORH|nr:MULTISPECIES: ABC transporter permease [Rhodococcus]MBF4480538.1 ABC transporter permease [Rhodococcus rhodochrous]MCD2097714.1 ABC transporter permease [Rhodococcus rhodochrous]MCD2121985.1 ABC transporter permease [Rhodococcus rhodochrous]MCQ4134998.1 ABC transporter permease [Rhodococcus rhodochrous]MDC3724624.1 ABC transporter permease [Rhodococcus sp. Rp3]
MFLAMRELWFARTRFLLMGAVVALISILMVILSGLSSGLVVDGVSALQRTPVQAFAFAEGTKTDSAFSRSVVTEDQADAWRARPDVARAELFGNTIVNAKTDGGTPVDLTLFGIRPGSFLEPSVAEGTPIGGDTDVVLSDSARATGVELGDTIVVDRLGTRLNVVGFTSDKRTFGHVDVAYLPLNTWQEIHAGVRLGEQVPPSAYTEASVVAIEGVDGALPDLAAGDAEAGTAAKTLEESFDASPGYSAEMMTMSMIIAFLYAISALVVGAFFTIWTVQRSREIAVLRAMGASTGFLLRDSLLQAVIVLVGSVAVGVLIGLGLGSGLEGSGMPFVLETGPIVQGAVLLVVLGLVGAALAVARIVRVDPLAALGENR